MPVVATKVTVSSVTPTLIATGGAIPISVTLANASAATIYLGGATVDATDGFPLGTGIFSVDLVQGDVLYAFASTGSPTVNVFKTRQ